MPSRTTLWRYRTGRVKLTAGGAPSTRGGKTSEARFEMFRFVGAVVAQLLAYGYATESGLKVYPSASDRNRARGPVKWLEPEPAVLESILQSEINPDCLALAAALVGQLVRHVRPASQAGTTHVESGPRRESSRHRDLNWKAVSGMNRKTAWYWRITRKEDSEKAKHWLWALLKKNGFESRFDADEALAAGTQSRDDLSKIIEGKTVRINRHDPDYSPAAPHYSVKRGRHNAGRQAAVSR